MSKVLLAVGVTSMVSLIVTTGVLLFLGEKNFGSLLVCFIGLLISLPLVPLVLYLAGALSPETFAITSKRIIVAKQPQGSVCISSVLLSEVVKFTARKSLLATGVQYQTRAMKASGNNNPLINVITCPEAIQTHVLRLANEAHSEALRATSASTPASWNLGSTGSSTVSSLPEKMQRQIAGETVFFVSREPLRRHVALHAAAAFLPLLAVILVCSLALLTTSPTSLQNEAQSNSSAPFSAPTPLNDTPAASPSALYKPANSLPLFLVVAGVGVFSIVIFFQSGVAGNGYLAITNSHVISAKSIFGDSVVLGVTKLTHRQFANASALYLPTGRTCSSSSPSLFMPRSSFSLAPAGNAPQIYGWIIQQAESSSRADHADLVL